MRSFILPSAFLLLISSAFAFGANYELDSAHSSVGFKIRHLMISSVEGNFEKIKGTGSGTFTKEKATIENIDIEIEVASINTREKKRDAHLKGEDFFNVKKFKSITFKLNNKPGEKSVEYNGNFPSKLFGKLTMMGITKDIILDVKWGGMIVDPWKNEKVGFEVAGKIVRKDYGLTWNKPLEAAGEFLIGDDVEFFAKIEATRIPEPAPATKSVPAKKK